MTEQQLAAMRQALEALDDLARYADTCELFLKETHPGKADTLGERVKNSIEAITSLRQAISQAETAQGQEPVAWRWKREGGEWQLVHQQPRSPTAQPLYTTPPAAPVQPKVRTGDCLLVGVCASEGHKIQAQRQWVGLTEEEIDELYETHHNEYGYPLTLSGYERAIEQRLKEKNTA